MPDCLPISPFLVVILKLSPVVIVLLNGLDDTAVTKGGKFGRELAALSGIVAFSSLKVAVVVSVVATLIVELLPRMVATDELNVSVQLV